MISVNRLFISSLDAAMLAESDTILLTISPSAIASGLTPVASIRMPFPVLSNREKVKSPFASRPACIRTVPSVSDHCCVAPWIRMPPSSEAIRNLFVEIVPARRSATDTVCITADRIRAESMTAFCEVRWMFCISPIPAPPDKSTLIFPNSLSRIPILALTAVKSVVLRV